MTYEELRKRNKVITFIVDTFTIIVMIPVLIAGLIYYVVR